MSAEQNLEGAGADLRAASASMPFPQMRVRKPIWQGFIAFATGLAVVLIVAVPLYLTPTSPPDGVPVGAPADTTTDSPDTTTTSVPPTTTTTESAPPACGTELPYQVTLPEDFTGPIEGPSPHAPDPAEDGQLIVHWLGRDGSVEIRWPANNEYLEGVEWGETIDWTGREFDEVALFLFTDPDPGTFQTVGAVEALPTEIMNGPCDASQLNVYASNNDSGFSSANSATFGQSEDADVIIYPNLPRRRDKVLVVETLEADTIPEVLACDGGPGVDFVPRKSGTIPNSSVFGTPEEALQDLLGTDAAGTWPKVGYFQLVSPDGTVTYGNPYDDNSPDPRPDNGLVISVTVIEVEGGWTVTEWETSGC